MRYACTEVQQMWALVHASPSPLRHSQNNSIGDTCKEYALRKTSFKRRGGLID